MIYFSDNFAYYVVNQNSGLGNVLQKLLNNDKGMVFIVNDENQLVGGISKSFFHRVASGAETVSLNQLIRPLNTVGKHGESKETIADKFSASVQIIPVVDNNECVIALAFPVGKAQGGVNLNVGSGGYRIPGFVDLDLPSQWYAEQQSSEIIPYNMRSDLLPFNDNTVDNIYCSHVIEHIEDIYVEKFLQEAYRVLKPCGVLRTVCPDADFLQQVSAFDNDYWRFRLPWFQRHNADLATLTQADFFIREIATPRSRFLASEKQISATSAVNLNNCINQLAVALCEDLIFDVKAPGNHINAWWFEKIQHLALAAGFARCVRSKYRGSVSLAMQGPWFDNTQPQMSLYADIVK